MSSINVSVNWQGNFLFSAKNEQGLASCFDAPVAFGGEGVALTPMENVLASLVACSSIHIVDILNMQKQKLDDFSIKANAKKLKIRRAVLFRLTSTMNSKGQI
jgi:uncharacterized OsmC-like protein